MAFVLVKQFEDPGLSSLGRELPFEGRGGPLDKHVLTSE